MNPKKELNIQAPVPTISDRGSGIFVVPDKGGAVAFP
jgi:hypothetical protein